MPWRLILFIVLIVVIAVFMGANMDNKSPVSLIFYTTNPLPVYLLILYSFCAGVLVMLPFTIGKRKKQEKKDSAADKKTDKIFAKKFGKKPFKEDKTETKTEVSADINTYEDKI